MRDKDKDTISAISELFVSGAQMESEIASNDLRFSIWIAAFATAGFGLLLVEGKSIVEASALPDRNAFKAAAFSFFLLLVSVILAGWVRYLINGYLHCTSHYVGLVHVQESRVLSGGISTAGPEILRSVVTGGYLRDGLRKELDDLQAARAELDQSYPKWLWAQIWTVAAAYVCLFGLGVSTLW